MANCFYVCFFLFNILIVDITIAESISTFSDTTPLKTPQVPSSLSDKVNVEEGSASNISIEVLEDTETDYTLSVTGDENEENISFYLQQNTLNISDSIENISIYIDKEKHRFYQDKHENTSYVVFNIPRFSSRTIHFNATSTGETLVDIYDSNGDGDIQGDEARKAIVDYLFEDKLSGTQIKQILREYLFK